MSEQFEQNSYHLHHEVRRAATEVAAAIREVNNNAALIDPENDIYHLGLVRRSYGSRKRTFQLLNFTQEKCISISKKRLQVWACDPMFCLLATSLLSVGVAGALSFLSFSDKAALAIPTSLAQPTSDSTAIEKAQTIVKLPEATSTAIVQPQVGISEEMRSALSNQKLDLWRLAKQADLGSDAKISLIEYPPTKPWIGIVRNNTQHSLPSLLTARLIPDLQGQLASVDNTRRSGDQIFCQNIIEITRGAELLERWCLHWGAANLNNSGLYKDNPSLVFWPIYVQGREFITAKTTPTTHGLVEWK